MLTRRFVVVMLAVLCALPSLAAGGRTCVTMELYEASRRGTPMFDVGFGERPTDIGATFDSTIEGHALRVHADPGVSEERALQVLAFFDAAWTKQIDDVGFPPPLADGNAGGDARFDVYALPLAPGLAGVTIATEDVDPNDGKHASASFIQIDPSLADDLLEVFAQHELQHALQFAIDTEEPVMWFEASAVFWEVRTNPAVDDWTLSLPDFQGSPQVPIFVDGTGAELLSGRPAARYEYGAVLFALYLDEVHGDGQGTILREIWQGTPQADEVDENEPDFIDALASRAVDPAVIADFVTWRTLVGPFSVDDDGPIEDVPAIGVLFAGLLNASTLDGDQQTTDAQDGPYPLGCIVRQVTAPANVEAMPVEVRVETTLANQLVRVALLVIDPESKAISVRRESASAASHFEEVSVPRANILQVAVCDVSPADPEDDLEVRPVTFSILRTDVEFPDAGTPGPDAGTVDGGVVEDPPAPECSCQSAPTTESRSNRTRNGLSAFAILGLLGMLIKGVRHVRRGRTLKPIRKRGPRP